MKTFLSRAICTQNSNEEPTQCHASVDAVHIEGEHANYAATCTIILGAINKPLKKGENSPRDELGHVACELAQLKK